MDLTDSGSDFTPNDKVALVTGATGFIGTHLVRALNDQRYTVRVYSRKRYVENNSLCVDPENWFTGELDDETRISESCRGVDAVFHLAGVADVNRSESEDLCASNVYGVRNLAQACVRNGVANFIFFSSVFAADPDHSAYARSKMDAESYLASLAVSASTTRIAILRLANVYGIGMRGNIASFVKSIRRGLMFSLPRLSGTFTMISVKDVCSAAISILEPNPQCGSPAVYTLTDGQEYTPNRLESAVYEALDRRAPRVQLPLAVLLLGSVFAQIANTAGIIKNGLGLNFFRRLTAKQSKLSTSFTQETFQIADTFESEISGILASLEPD